MHHYLKRKIKSVLFFYDSSPVKNMNRIGICMCCNAFVTLHTIVAEPALIPFTFPAAAMFAILGLLIFHVTLSILQIIYTQCIIFSFTTVIFFA